MNEELKKREQLSALADGQLRGAELAQAMEFAEQDAGRCTWQLYHLVGDVLRSPELARHGGDGEFMARLQQRLAQEPARPALQNLVPAVVSAARSGQAANTSVFRWKVVAGFASLAAVAAIGWNALNSLHGETTGEQLATAPTLASAPAPVQMAVAESQGSQVMIRDPRLDELLAAHKQFGGASALQLPAGFLRNATFDPPAR